MDFHQTGYGRRFFDGQLPRLIETLDTIAKEMIRANDFNEQTKVDSENTNFTMEHLEILADVIKQTNAYFIIDEIQKRNPNASMVLDELVK